MDEQLPLPNKCDYCGLRVRYVLASPASSQQHDKDFANLRRLQCAGIVDQEFRRNMVMSVETASPDTTDICAIAARAWNNNDEKCSHWMIKIEGATVADHLAIKESKSNFRVAVAAMVISLAAFLVSIFK